MAEELTGFVADNLVEAGVVAVVTIKDGQAEVVFDEETFEAVVQGGSVEDGKYLINPDFLKEDDDENLFIHKKRLVPYTEKIPTEYAGEEIDENGLKNVLQENKALGIKVAGYDKESWKKFFELEEKRNKSEHP